MKPRLQIRRLPEMFARACQEKKVVNRIWKLSLCLAWEIYHRLEGSLLAPAPLCHIAEGSDCRLCPILKISTGKVDRTTPNTKSGI
jgi:hypothetical protein